jgi:acetyltransferase-like isoleucine patch superfamily enzyme
VIAWLGDKVLDGFAAVQRRLAAWQARRRWSSLQALGMRIGRDVVLPSSTWIDTAHCYLIDIGDGCAFGPQCLILAHDAQMDEFLDAGRLGRVVIGAGCQIGARSVILCNVEIGAGCVIEAGSVVATSLPAGSFCAGSPAKVVCSVAEWTRRLERDAAGRPTLTPDELRARAATADGRQALRAELAGGAALVRPPDRQAAPLDGPLLP